jgi:hypothetical protein
VSLTRRGFFGVLAGAFVARFMPTPPPLPPVPIPGTWGAVERSTVPFWRADRDCPNGRIYFLTKETLQEFGKLYTVPARDFVVYR